MRKLVVFLYAAVGLLVGVGSSYADGSGLPSVPEPATLTLLVTGAAGLVGTGLIRRLKK